MRIDRRRVLGLIGAGAAAPAVAATAGAVNRARISSQRWPMPLSAATPTPRGIWRTIRARRSRTPAGAHRRERMTCRIC